MRALVTGGSGFIGSHVVDYLKAAGCKVRIFDMRRPYQEEWRLNDSVHGAARYYGLESTGIEYYQGSLLDYDAVRMALDDVDVVYHLAAVADVNVVQKDPKHSHDINCTGTVNLLEAMRYNGQPKRIVYASTVWVYSGSKEMDEQSLLPTPEHFYTATKLFGEHACITYSKMYDLDYTILRYGIPYGPRARGAAVIPLFVDKAMNGQPLTVAGDGKQGRFFIYVEDLARAHVCVLDHLIVSKNQIYNLESNSYIRIKDLVYLLKEHFPELKVEYVEGRTGDYEAARAATDKAKIDLDWQPEMDFEHGLQRYIKWYEKQLR